MVCVQAFARLCCVGRGKIFNLLNLKDTGATNVTEQPRDVKPRDAMLLARLAFEVRHLSSVDISPSFVRRSCLSSKQWLYIVANDTCRDWQEYAEEIGEQLPNRLIDTTHQGRKTVIDLPPGCTIKSVYNEVKKKLKAKVRRSSR